LSNELVSKLQSWLFHLKSLGIDGQNGKLCANISEYKVSHFEQKDPRFPDFVF